MLAIVKSSYSALIVAGTKGKVLKTKLGSKGVYEKNNYRHQVGLTLSLTKEKTLTIIYNYIDLSSTDPGFLMIDRFINAVKLVIWC